MNLISKRNIPLMYLIKFFQGLHFAVAISYLFQNQYGLGTTELYIVQSIFALGMVTLEIPTGFISDKYSRKLSLILGLVLVSLGYFAYSQGTGLGGFVIAELILAVGFCCISGTDTSLIYDSLAHDHKSDEYKKVSGRYFSIASFVEGVGSLCGGYLALTSLQVPFVLDGIGVAIAAIIALFLIEPPRSKLESQEGSRSQVRTILFRTYKHKKVFWLIVFSAVTSCMTLSMVWFSQPYMQLVGLPIVYIGWFRFVMNAGGSVISLFIHNIEKFLTERIFMMAIIVWGILCMMTLAFFPSLWLLPVFFLFQITRQGNRLISNDNLHILSDSSIRATIQSISSMAFRLSFAIRGPIFGWLYSQYGLVPALGAASVVLGGIAIGAWWKFENSKAIVS